MKLTDKVKAQIDGLTYIQLLERWRYAPAGTEVFQGESGDYWRERMKFLQAQPGGHAMAVAASKALGW